VTEYPERSIFGCYSCPQWLDKWYSSQCLDHGPVNYHVHYRRHLISRSHLRDQNNVDASDLLLWQRGRWQALTYKRKLVSWSTTHSHTHSHHYHHCNYHLTSSSHYYQSTSQALVVSTLTPQYHPSTFNSTRERLNPPHNLSNIKLSNLLIYTSHHATLTHHPHHIPHHCHPRRSRPKSTSHRHTMLRQL
jgi:hypothetical protein